jgi:hypothetical protein
MESLNWRKASYSAANGGGCVEVADQAARVIVRDTNDLTGPCSGSPRTHGVGYSIRLNPTLR